MTLDIPTWEGLCVQWPWLERFRQGALRAARTGTALENVIGMFTVGMWSAGGGPAALPVELRPAVIYHLLQAFVAEHKASRFTDRELDAMLQECDPEGGDD